MKNIRKIIKKVFISIGVLVSLVVIATLLFVNFSPQFGGQHTPEDIVRFEQSDNYQNGQFKNLTSTKSSPSLSDFTRLLKAMTADVPNDSPTAPIQVEKVTKNQFINPPEETRIMWFGHSAFLIEIQGKRLLVDPMLSDVPAPHPWLGSQRFSNELPIDIEDLPIIDAVILSHDHYDHLDYETIQRIKGRVNNYYVPLGLGTHLQAWGVAKSAITELDWWQETTLDNLTLVATPARHFSGRGFSDAKATLWASWVIQSNSERIFFSGDSGYGDHFKSIGEKYGPFDLALMECGQYNDALPDYPIHMYPEETAQAALDINANYTMPIHWGAFKLNQHPWKEPVERLTAEATALNVALVTPKIGQIFSLNALADSSTNWWKDY